MADPATHAWAHCLVVLRDPDEAEEAAATAVRRGGRSRTAVLAHARWQALARAGDPPDLSATPLADLDLLDVAELLGATRPAVERALVDLDTRLDRAHLARALGLTATETAARLSDVATAWDRELDPALLAWLGPGDCPELATMLGVPVESPAAEGAGDEDAGGDAGAIPAAPATIGDLLALAPSVDEHTGGCETCADRRRSLVSVRALQARLTPPPLPGVVRAASNAGRFRLPGPLPPPLGATPAPETHRRHRRAALAAVAGLGVALLAAGVIVVVTHRGGGGTSPTASPAALASLPGGGSGLAVSPTQLSATGSIELRNTTRHAIAWQATSSAAWIVIDPAGGRLGPRAVVVVGVRLLDTAPAGGGHATVNISGSDGSAASAYVTSANHDTLGLAAQLSGCTVAAQIVDDVDATAILHYVIGGTGDEHTLAMTAAAGGAASAVTADLPALPSPVTWWVSASDQRGASATTAHQVLAANACTS